MGRPRIPLRQRIFSKLEICPAPITHDCFGRPIVGPCLIYTGSPKNKYAMVWDADQGVPVLVHRAMFEMFVGPAEGQIDHLCRVYKCASPAHLEDVSQRENLRRHMLTYEQVEPLSADPETCLRGHPRNPENTRYARMYGGLLYPVCKACVRGQVWEARQRAREERGQMEVISYRGPMGLRTRCPQDHPYAGDNLYVDPRTGRRSCRACKVIHSRAYKERQRAKSDAAA
jgi:hypothetical protein